MWAVRSLEWWSLSHRRRHPIELKGLFAREGCRRGSERHRALWRQMQCVHSTAETLHSPSLCGASVGMSLIVSHNGCSWRPQCEVLFPSRISPFSHGIFDIRPLTDLDVLVHHFAQRLLVPYHRLQAPSIGMQFSGANRDRLMQILPRHGSAGYTLAVESRSSLRAKNSRDAGSRASSV